MALRAADQPLERPLESIAVRSSVAQFKPSIVRTGPLGFIVAVGAMLKPHWPVYVGSTRLNTPSALRMVFAT
jgi:hypothetical protein